MIKKYKMTRTVKNVEALQLKENNIMEMARFLDSNDFWALMDNTDTAGITGIVFTVIGKNDDEINWDSDIEFGTYIVKIDGDYEAYSEKEFKQLFTEEK